MATGNEKTIGALVKAKPDWPKLIQSRFEGSKKLLSQRHDTWRKIRNAYHGYVADQAKKRGRANFHHHLIFQQIEMETARFIVNYFRHDPFIAVSPINANTMETAKRHEQVLQHYNEHAPTFFIEKYRLLKYSHLYGTGFEMPTWRREVRPVMRKVPITYAGQQINEVEVETNEVVYDGLWFKTFSPFDVFPYPFANSLASSPWVILVEFVRADELLKRADAGIFDKGAVMKVPLNGYLQDEWEFARQLRDLGHGTPDQDDELVCLQHMFTPDRFITLANNAEIVRDQPNMFWHGLIPMVQGVKTLDPDSFYPIGSGKNLLASQKLLSMTSNAMIDNVVQSQWPIWKYTSAVNPNDLVSLPNQRIKVETLDDVDVVKMPELKQDLLQLKAVIEAHAQTLTGYFGPQQGFSDTQHTATSDSIFQQEGNQRISGDVMAFEQLTLVPEARMVSKLVQQFMPEGVDVRINGPGGQFFQKLSPQDIRGEFDFTASGSSESINRAVVQQQLIEMFSVANEATQYVQMPTGQIIPVPVLDAYNALKQIYEGYNQRNTDKLLYRPEVFGLPLNNELLNQYGLPAVPGLDQMPLDPMTGARRANAGSLPMPNRSSVNPGDIVNGANRAAPQSVRAI